MPNIVDLIKAGDRVTIVDRFGKEQTGRAVMRSSVGGWVLNMGGRYGKPGLADSGNITRVKQIRHNPSAKKKRSKEMKILGMPVITAALLAGAIYWITKKK